jgi:hypothetical protein
MAFFWKGDQLFTKRAPVPDAEQKANADWTSFYMQLREPMEIPSTEEFGKFLATSLSFTRHLTSVSMVRGNTHVLSIKKTPAPASPVNLKSLGSFHLKSKGNDFAIKSLSTSQVQMSASWEGDGEPEVIFIRIATAAIGINVSKRLAAEIERTTKKRPPSETNVHILYTGYADYEASQLVRSKRSLFTELYPFPNQGRIFIGFQTHQTTGMCSHLGAHFIPTVERESIDFVDPSLRYWNTELLGMCGKLSHILYEHEMKEVQQMYDNVIKHQGTGSDAAEYLEKRAMHAMQSFTYKQTTPSPIIGRALESAFFAANSQPPLIFSTRGVLAASKVRLRDPSITFIRNTPLLTETTAKACGDLVGKLEQMGYLKPLDVTDIVAELAGRRLIEEEIIAVMKWWLEFKKQRPEATKQVILDPIVLPDGLSIGKVSAFLNASMILPNLPLPPIVLPHTIGKNFTHAQLETEFRWQPLAIAKWIDFILTRPELESDAAFAESILANLSRIWASLNAATKAYIIERLSKKRCMPTKLGMFVPPDAYSKSVTLFPDLPLVELGKNVAEAFLVALGVRKHVELQLVFDRLSSLKWDHTQLIKFLAAQETIGDKEIARLQMTPFFPKEDQKLDEATNTLVPTKSKTLFKASDLYVPTDEMRRLNLPVLFWTTKWRNASPESKFLCDSLKLNRFPSVTTLLAIAGSADPQMRALALAYFIEQHKDKYEQLYKPGAVKVAFLPSQKNDKLLLPNECYAHPGASVLGFEILRADLQQHADKVKVLQHPPASFLVNKLRSQPPKGHAEAQTVYEYLSTQQSSTLFTVVHDVRRFLPFGMDHLVQPLLYSCARSGRSAAPGQSAAVLLSLQ